MAKKSLTDHLFPNGIESIARDSSLTPESEFMALCSGIALAIMEQHRDHGRNVALDNIEETNLTNFIQIYSPLNMYSLADANKSIQNLVRRQKIDINIGKAACLTFAGRLKGHKPQAVILVRALRQIISESSKSLEIGNIASLCRLNKEDLL